MNIDHARDLDLRSVGESVFIAAQAVLQVRLVGHGEDDDVAFAVQFLRQSLTAGEARLIVICPDEEQALARGRVGIQGDDGNACGDGLVDAVFEQSWHR